MLKNLNNYSWSLIIAFICAMFAMHYPTCNLSFSDLFQAFPLIIFAVYYSQKLAPLISQPEQDLKKSQLFRRDLFILSFSFLFACLLSLILSYSNSDAKGWWLLTIYFVAIYGLLFAMIFSAVALLVKNHKIYTILFSRLLIALVVIGQFFPHYIFIPLLENIATFYVATWSLLIFHCLFVINYKIIRLIQQV